MTLPISTVCENCGAALKLKNPDLVGKKVKCPNCGEPFVVSEAVAAKPKVVKKKSADDDGFMDTDLDDYDAPPPDEDFDDEDDAPVRRRKSGGGKKKKGKKSASNGNTGQVLTIVAITLTVVLALGAGGYGGWVLWSSWPNDADWLPTETDGYMKFQVSRIWSSGALQPFVVDDAAKKFVDDTVKNVGAAPQDIDQITVGIQNTRTRGSEVAVVKFKQPFNLEKLQQTLPKAEFVSHERSRYLKSRTGSSFLADPKTLVQGSETNIKALMTRGRSNPSASKFSFASGCRDHVVYAVYQKIRTGQSCLTNPFLGFADVPEMNPEQILVQANASTDIDITVRTTFQSSEAAKQQVDGTQTELAKVKTQFAEQKSQIQGMPATPQVDLSDIIKAFGGVEQVLNSVSITQSGSRTVTRLKVSGQLVKDATAAARSPIFSRVSPVRRMPSFFPQ